MKALTVAEPWASLIADGYKHVETRSWPTPYRGPLAIHAADHNAESGIDHVCARLTQGAFNPAAELEAIYTMRYHPGCIVATCQITSCDLIEGDVPRGVEWALGDYTPGRFQWRLADVRRIDPVPARGQQGLWEWDGR